MKKLNTWIFYLLILAIISCENSNKEYYESGNLKLIHYYNNNKKIDSSIYYYDVTPNRIEHIDYWRNSNDSAYQVNYTPNGSKKSEGYLLNSNGKFISVGKWFFFNKHEHVELIKEFINVEGESYFNQAWNLNTQGDTLIHRTHYFDIFKNRDTFSFKNPFRAIAKVRVPLFKNKKSSISVVIPKGDFNFNDDFSNETDIDLTTFHNLIIDSVNQKWFENKEYPYTVAFGKKFKSSGEKLIRGYIVESYEEEDSLPNTIIKTEHRKYFEFPVYIKNE